MLSVVQDVFFAKMGDRMSLKKLTFILFMVASIGVPVQAVQKLDCSASGRCSIVTSDDKISQTLKCDCNLYTTEDKEKKCSSDEIMYILNFGDANTFKKLANDWVDNKMSSRTAQQIKDGVTYSPSEAFNEFGLNAKLSYLGEGCTPYSYLARRACFTGDKSVTDDEQVIAWKELLVWGQKKGTGRPYVEPYPINDVCSFGDNHSVPYTALYLAAKHLNPNVFKAFMGLYQLADEDGAKCPNSHKYSVYSGEVPKMYKKGDYSVYIKELVVEPTGDKISGRDVYERKGTDYRVINRRLCIWDFYNSEGNFANEHIFPSRTADIKKLGTVSLPNSSGIKKYIQSLGSAVSYGLPIFTAPLVPGESKGTATINLSGMDGKNKDMIASANILEILNKLSTKNKSDIKELLSKIYADDRFNVMFEYKAGKYYAKSDSGLPNVCNEDMECPYINFAAAAYIKIIKQLSTTFILDPSGDNSYVSPKPYIGFEKDKM